MQDYPFLYSFTAVVCRSNVLLLLYNSPFCRFLKINNMMEIQYDHPVLPLHIPSSSGTLFLKFLQNDYLNKNNLRTAAGVLGYLLEPDDDLKVDLLATHVNILVNDKNLFYLGSCTSKVVPNSRPALG